MTKNNTRNDSGQFESQGTVSEYQDIFEQYSDWVNAFTEKDQTASRRIAGCKSWFLWCADTDTNPLCADEHAITQWVQDVINDGYADTTISSRFTSISMFYTWLLSDSGIDHSIEDHPTESVELSRYGVSNSSQYKRLIKRDGRKDIIAPSYDEFEPMFNTVPGKTDFVRVRNELICRLFWQTALRSDELSRVKTENVDLDKRQIEVRSSKLNEDDHDLYVRKTFFEDTLDYLMHRYLDKRADKDPESEYDYLIIGNRGGKVNPSTLSRIVKDSAHEAGIQEPLTTNPDGSVKQWLYTAHRLRHSRITHLANKTDMDLNFIRMLAGHEQIETTLEYVDNDWDEARNAYHAATGTS